MHYTAITPDQQRHQLETIGVGSIDDLFAAIPESSRYTESLNIPSSRSELELQRTLEQMASENSPAASMACFAGGGAYDHFIPTFIDQLISRGEFLTAYTPYQAEASQGSLQAFFEFQSQIARLTGMDIANASLYDGATAVAEAVNLALNTTGKRRVLVASTIHPHTIQTIRTHLADLPVDLIELPAGTDGTLTPAVVSEHTNDDTACLVVQSPNFLGNIENWTECFSSVRNGSTVGKPPLAIAVTNPIACALLKTPGDCDADIACGEGQPLGIPLQFGGPYLGFFAAKQSFLRKMPGRLVGQAEDANGRKSFALVLQTREQHIRGAKATSNVCTNQGLLALRATMYMTAMGRQGVREVAEQCWHKAHSLARRIDALEGYSLRHDAHFFNEFVVTCPRPASDIIEACAEHDVLPGIALNSPSLLESADSHDLLVAVTEKRSADDLDLLVSTLHSIA
ncbi:MAG: aminomethyl-transferring glycine dehydrogenase subunit GcvPA [Planctomycetota bacterium]|jgi:glycine dehydrogenase subunit 1